MRRTTKPFTIEIRRNGRQSEASSISLQPSWPEPVAEPPTSMWEPTAAPPPPSPAAGRVLPALDVQDPSPAPAAEIIKRRPRKRKPVGAAVLAWTGKQPDQAEPDDPIVPAPAGKPDIETHQTRSPRPRAARTDFPLGERWKARLPRLRRPRRSQSPSA